jgi:hypothetical protein
MSDDSPMKNFNLGKFKIAIALDCAMGTRLVSVANITKYYKKYQHPNVSMTNFCLGDLTKTIEQQIRTGNYRGAIVSLIMLLRKPDITNPYLHQFVTLWLRKN